MYHLIQLIEAKTKLLAFLNFRPSHHMLVYMIIIQIVFGNLVKHHWYNFFVENTLDKTDRQTQLL